MKRVPAIEYQDTNSLFIEGGDHVCRKLPGVPVNQMEMKMENLEPSGVFDVQDREAEEAIETLLKELDNWKEDKKERLESEN